MHFYAIFGPETCVGYPSCRANVKLTFQIVNFKNGQLKYYQFENI
jgi:hypothetical protein